MWGGLCVSSLSLFISWRWLWMSRGSQGRVGAKGRLWLDEGGRVLRVNGEMLAAVVVVSENDGLMEEQAGLQCGNY